MPLSPHVIAVNTKVVYPSLPTVYNMHINLDGYRKKLEKLAKAYFETYFLVAGLCKVIPFCPLSGPTPYKRHKLFDRRYQKCLVCTAECLLIFLTLFHIYTFKTYVSQNGVDLQSTIYVTYVMVYITALLFSITGTLHGREAVTLLNAVGDSRESELFSGRSWESDLFLQFFTLQIIPLSGCVCFGSGLVLPWLYPDGPWMLMPKIPGFQSLPGWVRIPSTCVTELVNIFLPSISCLGTGKVFMIGLACIKILLQQLRFVP